MSREYEILKANKTDAEEILRLQYAAYQSEAVIYNDYSIQPLTQSLEQAMTEFEDSVILKAVSDDKIIGSVRGCEKESTVYIGKLMVLPDYQGRGVGKRLLQAIESDYPGKRFELFTGAKSEKNLKMYEKYGYVRFKTEKAAPGLTFIYLEKQIPIRISRIGSSIIGPVHIKEFFPAHVLSPAKAGPVAWPQASRWSNRF